ncbi:hypothetical protein [Flavobacterium sp.]|uniref:hypothetical protein n=1 Tax=Flavobacterium sp. TaxID=239 RepID=UPI001B492BA2|nr:hypothetical protein [Flavobacterium sp.]MBP6127774.1 hypothetical protein [Flavobacterium sp.]
MIDKPKILMFSILGLIAIAILTQYEIREYLRFVPSNYFRLKLVLQYGTAIVFIAISAIGGIKLFFKHKTLYIDNVTMKERTTLKETNIN